ncbi:MULTISPECIES: c-type cytochrome [Bacillaceae]|uniref:Cytochrome c n=1 Tax=Evansella alkalicola TaxID=745819 RepID=A0ABS6JV69_9BACI|nr:MULTISPECIES: cytochrome c [Bacillaceae]MBU9722484.1 cytochrome c [Bacillus alkalicola]
MKGKPLYPFAITAVLGIGLIIILSFYGLNQGGEMAGEDGAEEVQFETSYELGEHVYEQNCISCHGGDLSGVGGNPALNDLEGRMSPDDIATIISGGTDGGMPAFGQLSNDELDAVVEFLLEESE